MHKFTAVFAGAAIFLGGGAGANVMDDSDFGGGVFFYAGAAVDSKTHVHINIDDLISESDDINGRFGDWVIGIGYGSDEMGAGRIKYDDELFNVSKWAFTYGAGFGLRVFIFDDLSLKISNSYSFARFDFDVYGAPVKLRARRQCVEIGVEYRF